LWHATTNLQLQAFTNLGRGAPHWMNGAISVVLAMGRSRPLQKKNKKNLATHLTMLRSMNNPKRPKCAIATVACHDQTCKLQSFGRGAPLLFVCTYWSSWNPPSTTKMYLFPVSHTMPKLH